jgi:uncharacterized membrane protein
VLKKIYAKIKNLNWILILILALALAVRLFKIDSQGFSLDESSSLLFAGTPEWRALFWDNNPILYHLLLKIWLWVFPMTEFYTRLLSTLFSCLGVLLIYRLGMETGSKRRATAFALALAFSTLSIRYAQETRMYSLLEMTTIFHVLMTFRTIREDSLRNRIFFAISCLIVAGTHFIGAVVAVFGLTLVFVQSGRHRRIFLITVASLLLLVVASLAISFRPQYVHWQQTMRVILGDKYYLLDLVTALGQNSLLIGLLMCLIAATAAFHDGFFMRVWARRIILYVVGVLVCCAFLSWVDERNVFIPRYFIFLNPLLVFLFVGGIEKISELGLVYTKKFIALEKSRGAVGRMIQFVILVTFVSQFSHAYEYSKAAWREASVAILAKHPKVIWTTRTLGLKMPYYLRDDIEFSQFAFDETSITKIVEKLKKVPTLWILDNYTARLNYFDILSRLLVDNRIPFSVFEYSSGDAESVFVLEIGRQAE